MLEIVSTQDFSTGNDLIERSSHSASMANEPDSDTAKMKMRLGTNLTCGPHTSARTRERACALGCAKRKAKRARPRGRGNELGV